jgi:hypothetical protein
MSCNKVGGRRTRRRGGGDEEPPKQDIKLPVDGGRRRTMKGGNFYGVGAAIAPGVLERTAVENNAVDAKSGATIPDYAMPGGRRRKSRKGGKKSRKVSKKGRRRTMRGGANWVSAGAVGAAFKGDGQAGMQSYSAYAQKAPPGGPTQNPDGAYRA